MSSPLSSDRRVQAAHLLRRAGFGGTTAEINALAAMSHNDAVNKLLNFTVNGSVAYDLERKLADNGYQIDNNSMEYWWLLNMARTTQPLQEKMTLFWHGHFTSASSKVKDPLTLLDQNQLYRDNALGNFKDLTKKVSRNPAMIDYLDGQSNRKGAPNENYARELMELFTIGIGNYTETDVREAARAFTGWSYKDRAYVFQANQHDTGSKTFMGKTGNFNGDDIIDIILARPESGRFITTKLWEYFVYDQPESSVIDGLTDLYFKNNYEIKPVVQAILTSPQFLSDKAYRGSVKGPVEYTVGMLKDLNSANIQQNVIQASNSMGQVLFNPPTVKGWDGGVAWINSSYFFNRANAANNLADTRSQTVAFHYNPYGLLNGQNTSSAAVVNQFVNLFLDGQTSDAVRSALTSYLDNGQNLKASDFTAAANPTTAAAKAVDARVRGTVHLIMSSPDYMLK